VFSGRAGTAAGDQPAITVKLYHRIGATGTPSRTLTATARAGHWSVVATTPLPGGTWTAQASQTNEDGHTGASTANTFNLTTPTVEIIAPRECSHTTRATPALEGRAGNATGDSRTITIKLYAGWRDTGTPIRTLSATRTGDRWHTTTPAALPHNTYTVEATQKLRTGTSTSPAIKFTIT
jgi:hypothetical protein